jgi:uncharacterized protein (DUF1778 family)
MALAPISFRATPQEKRVLQVVAAQLNLTVSEFLRQTSINAAIDVLREQDGRRDDV